MSKYLLRLTLSLVRKKLNDEYFEKLCIQKMKPTFEGQQTFWKSNATWQTVSVSVNKIQDSYEDYKFLSHHKQKIKGINYAIFIDTAFVNLDFAIQFSSLVIFTSEISISIENGRRIDYTTIQTAIHLSVKAIFCLK